MKRKIYMWLFLSCLSIVVLASIIHLIPKEPSHHKIAEKLLTFMNGKDPRFHLKTDLKNSTVEPLEDNRYIVTFKNCIFNSDLTRIVGSLLKNWISEENPYKIDNATRIDEWVIVYDPEEKKYYTRSMKGWEVDIDISELAKKDSSSISKRFKMQNVRASIGKATFHEFPLTRERENGNTDAVVKARNIGMAVRRHFDSELEDVNVEISGVLESGEKLQIFLELEEFESDKSGFEDPYTTVYFFEKNAPPPDLSMNLRKGLAIIDRTKRLGKINVLIRKNGLEYGSGSIEKASVFQSLKPDETGAHFEFGSGIRVENFGVSIPGKREVELLGQIKECQFTLSMEHLSPEVVLGCCYVAGPESYLVERSLS